MHTDSKRLLELHHRRLEIQAHNKEAEARALNIHRVKQEKKCAQEVISFKQTQEQLQNERVTSLPPAVQFSRVSIAGRVLGEKRRALNQTKEKIKNIKASQGEALSGLKKINDTIKNIEKKLSASEREKLRHQEFKEQECIQEQFVAQASVNRESLANIGFEVSPVPSLSPLPSDPKSLPVVSAIQTQKLQPALNIVQRLNTAAEDTLERVRAWNTSLGQGLELIWRHNNGKSIELTLSAAARSQEGLHIRVSPRLITDRHALSRDKEKVLELLKKAGVSVYRLDIV